MAASKKSPFEKTNTTLRKRIKHPAIRLAAMLEFPSLSAMIDRMLEVQLIRHGLIKSDIEAVPEDELRAASTNRKAHPVK